MRAGLPDVGRDDLLDPVAAAWVALVSWVAAACFFCSANSFFLIALIAFISSCLFLFSSAANSSANCCACKSASVCVGLELEGMFMLFHAVFCGCCCFSSFWTLAPKEPNDRYSSSA